MGKVKLVSPSGSITLVPEDVAGANEVTVPLNGFGKVLQVQSISITDRISMSATGVFNDILGYELAITPTSATSKILVQISLTSGSPAGYGSAFLVTRDNVGVLNGIPVSNRVSASFLNGSGDNDHSAASGITGIDTPNTTSEVIYRLQAKVQTAGAITMNSTYFDTDTADAYSARSISTITLTEIGA